MITRKSREELKLMRHAGSIVALVHQEMKKAVCEGISTYELDQIASKIIRDNKAIPTFLNYHGYPASICTSVNEQVVHGIPSKDIVLQAGDIISIDVGATYRGLVGDSAWTYPVGEISQDKKMLLETTEKALMAGVSRMISGNLLEEVSAAVEDVALSKGLGIVRQYGGHGVGRNMHEDPFVFNYRTGNKTVLKSGMTIAIEPMLNLGKDDVYVLDDDWTVVTADDMASAHFEHTVLVGDDGPEILTKLS
ncbi:TPA: type I methionyl aminopeptidase [Candidatus Galligastranaerophilus intestinavium]|uniref:Methionine aminopeptidase n=1 Tax=Candidatus Galligastranaerophilus intestinavium TaxID=2840836 RepID=A0A9D1JYR7_9BACT|nr:type I methionyl aminopeptidase [Candidatus Galligastranaerophilus intestinavium]